MEIMEIVFVIIAFVLGFGISYIARYFNILKANTSAAQVIDEANKKANNIEKSAILDAKTLAHEYKMQAEEEAKVRRQEIVELEQILLKKEQAIDKRDMMLASRQEILMSKEDTYEKKSEKLKNDELLLEKKINEQLEILEKISGYTKIEAKEVLIEQVKSQIESEMAAMIRDAEDEAKETAEEKAKNLIANAMQRFSAEQANERTIATVSLPSEEMKGRIIGREGRNIRAIEAATGVDLIIDDTPEAITVSCFDPIRREIAKLSIETLIQDGRIQPGRIDEIVNKSRENVNKVIKEAGEQAIFELGLTKVNKELVMMIGKLKFRTSYGQSALKHSMEVAYLSGMLAAEIGEDENLARRAGLLHDIGKAIDFEQEGSHIELGAKYARKYGENDIVINGIETHHGNKPPIGIIPILVTTADALSASRPGARMESLENYVKRLEKLEAISNEFEGVESTYAVQAGREIRVIVKPELIDDLQCFKLAREIREKIENEMTYPGQIKVNVIRETKAVEIAK